MVGKRFPVLKRRASGREGCLPGRDGISAPHLDAENVLKDHFPGEVRVLAIPLVAATPERVPHDVHHRRPYGWVERDDRQHEDICATGASRQLQWVRTL